MWRMGLDVYVGPLTRYYAANWETILQQVTQGRGVPVEIFRPKQGWFHRLLYHLRFRGRVAGRTVRCWRNRLRRELDIADLDWNEDPDVEYASDEPAWDCYGALVLWAAYDELPSAKRRETDPAYLTSRANPHSLYQHLMADTEIWLPVEFGAPVRTAAIVGDSIVVGSSPRLFG